MILNSKLDAGIIRVETQHVNMPCCLEIPSFTVHWITVIGQSETSHVALHLYALKAYFEAVILVPNQIKCFLDTFIQYVFDISSKHVFQGDLTDVSAETKQ